MTELQFYKSKARILKVPAYYEVIDGKIVLDIEEIDNKFQDELSRIESLAQEVKA